MAKKQPNQPNLSLQDLINQRQQPSRIDYLNMPIPPKQDIGVDLIDPNPFQPRRVFDETKLNELATSIQQYGVFTPLIVRPFQGRFQLVSGERRLRAAKLTSLKVVPVLLGDYSDERMREIALLENIQRQDLNRLEEAQAYYEIMKINQWTQQQLADHMGKSRPHVANLLRLLHLPSKVQELLLNQTLTMGQVRPLIGLSEEVIPPLIEQILKNHLSAREVEALLRSQTTPSHFKFHNKVSVQVTPTHVMIPYESEQELKRILKKLNKQQFNTRQVK